MRMSRLFSETLREIPSEAKSPGHQLLLRAGFIRPLAAGIFSELHLGRRALSKIESIMRQEMDAIGGQEIRMPVIHPAEIWKETGRWVQIGDEMGRFKDRTARDMVLAMTHEEVIADLVRKEVRSYRQLPLLLYHLQTKWRDDPRPRAGLIRAREFTMLDSYSLDADIAGMDEQYDAHYHSYFKIFHRCGLPVIAVKSDVGMMGGTQAHEFMYLNPIGEDSILICDGCGYMANRQVARMSKPTPSTEDQRPLEKVATPGAHTIADLAAFLDIPKSKTAKAIFLLASPMSGDQIQERLIFAIVRGDMDLNETKLANALGARALRPATEEEIAAIGAVPGFASPIGLENAFVVVDDLIPASPNLVAGANEVDHHLLNVNYGRDFQADLIVDLVESNADAPCPRCQHPMRSERGVEVGNIFKLGTRYSEAMGATYLDRDGRSTPVIMGSYGIGLGRLLACIAEEHQDEDGLLWPIAVTPYEVHLISLEGKIDLVEQIYQQLRAEGNEVLYDDRDERPGVKFKDADLIGLPLRLTYGKRSLEQGGVELKARHEDERRIVPMESILPQVISTLAALKEAWRGRPLQTPEPD